MTKSLKYILFFYFVITQIISSFSIRAYIRLNALEASTKALTADMEHVKKIDWKTLCEPASVRCVGIHSEYSSVMQAVDEAMPGDIILMFGNNYSVPGNAFLVERQQEPFRLRLNK